MTHSPDRFQKYDTKDLWRKDRDHFIHPWTNYTEFKRDGSIVIAESEGAYVYDADGKQFLDGMAGIWCMNIGYGRADMAQTIADQVMRVPYYNVFTDTVTPPVAELAAKLADLSPGNLNNVFFSTGGSVANDSAIRVIHHYFNRLGKPNKKKIISRMDGYHGSTYLAMTLTGMPDSHAGFDLAPDLVHYVSSPNTYRPPNGMDEAQFCDFLVEEFEAKILELGADNVAAFIAEPLLGSGGVLVPPTGYHTRMEAVCRKYGVLTISDEVVTGFGRLGEFFASEKVFDLKPDIITCAKGISGGYIPLGATLFSDEIYEVISAPDDDDATFTHGFTYSGHAVACAAGLKTIEIMENEGICEHVRALSPYFKERMSSLLEFPIVGDVRGSHFMLCVENVADKETKALLPAEAKIGKRIAKKCQELGLMVRPSGHLNIISPPLILTKEQIDDMVDMLGKSIMTITDELVQEGLL